MKIGILGTGAIGGYFGGRLAEAGHDVTFIARGRTLEVLRERGLRITSPEGDLELHPVRATEDPAEVGPVDLVLVCVKAWQVSSAGEMMRPMIGEATAVLPLQNGVEAAAHLVEVLGDGPVLDGLCKIICRVEEPGHVVHFGARPFIEFGERDDSDSERVRAIQQALEGAGLGARIARDIRAAVWEKLLFLAAVSGVGAVTRSPLGVLRELPETRSMLETAMGEIASVARAHGVAIRPDAVERAMHFVDGLPSEATASMQRDVMAGRPSELEAQIGAVVRLGREAGVETPLHGFLYRSLLPMEMQARDRSS